MSNDNNLGMGRAEELWRVIDPESMSPEVLEMLNDMPGDRITHILAACKDFKDDFARAIVLKMAQDEEFTREGRNHGEIASLLHLAAVMASVIAAFPEDPVLKNTDGSPASLIVSNVYRCKESLERYWIDDVESFQLDEKNRAYFVRGWTLLTFTGIGEVIMDAELDRHLMWVGSRFDDLRAHAPEIIASGRFDREGLEQYADSSFDHDEITLADGSPNQQWYADNRDRLMGYSKDGYYSLFPESITRDILSRYEGTSVTVCGVPIRIEEFIYLEAKSDGPLDETMFMKLFGMLAEGMEMETPFGGKAALLLSTFNDASIHIFGHLIAGYNSEVRGMILKMLLDHAALRKPVNAPHEDEQFIGTLIAIAPVFHAFFEAKYFASSSSEPVEFESTDWKDFLEEGHDDAMWNAIHDCVDHLSNVDLDDDAKSDVGMMIMFMRAMTLAYFVNVEAEGPEDRTVIDVAMVNENIESICNNASVLIRENSLSFETISKLPKS